MSKPHRGYFKGWEEIPPAQNPQSRKPKVEVRAEPKICHCGQVFIPVNKRQKICGPLCISKSHAKELHDRQVAKMLAAPMPQPPKELSYPRNLQGALIVRDLSLRNKLRHPLPDIPASQVGGLDWTFTQMFGSPKEGVKLLESLVAGQGREADQKVLGFLVALKYSEEQGNPATLNSIASIVELQPGDLIAFMVSGIRKLSVALAQAKVAQEMPRVIQSALDASKDLEKGGKDREVLLKIGGVLEDKGGVSVNVNQQVGVVVKPEELKAPLRQFRGEIEDLDNIARDEAAIIDAEIIGEANQ